MDTCRKKTLSKDLMELKNESNEYILKQDFPSAVVLIEKAIEICRDRKDYVFAAIFCANLSYVYVCLKKYDLAVSCGRDAIKYNPPWIKGYFRAAEAHLLLREVRLNEDDKIKQENSAMLLLRECLSVCQSCCTQNTDKDFDHVKKLLNQLHIQMGTETSKVDPSLTTLQVFRSWFARESERENSIVSTTKSSNTHGALEIVEHNPVYRSVVAQKPIYENSIVLQVPDRMIMSVGKAKTEISKFMHRIMLVKDHVSQKQLTQHIEKMDSHTLLALFLLIEKHKNKSSYWKPYLDILPTSFTNMPVMYDNSKLELLLKNSYAYEFALQKRENLKRDYDEWVKWYSGQVSFSSTSCSLQTEPFHVNSLLFSLEDFIWARTVVITRVFEIWEICYDGKKEKEDESKQGTGVWVASSGLVPYADMLNHSEEKNVVWFFDKEKKAFIIRGKNQIDKGGAVLDSYGSKCNSRFLINYGFALDNNTANEAVLMIPDDHSCWSEIEWGHIQSFLLSENVWQHLYHQSKPKLPHPNEQQVKENHLYNAEDTDDEEEGLPPSHNSSSSKREDVQNFIKFKIPCDYASDRTQTVYSALRYLCASKEEKEQIHDIWNGINRGLELKNVPQWIDIKPVRDWERKQETVFDLFQSSFCSNPFFHINPISTDNELSVLKMLSGAARKTMNRFPTSLEQDQKEMERIAAPSPTFDCFDNDNNNNPYGGASHDEVINCLRMRIGEKKVLSFYISLFKKVSGWMDLAQKTKSTKKFKHFKHSVKEEEKYFYKAFLHDLNIQNRVIFKD